MTHQHIQGGILWAGWARFVQGQILTPVSSPQPWTFYDRNSSPLSKLCAQDPEFLAAALTMATASIQFYPSVK